MNTQFLFENNLKLSNIADANAGLTGARIKMDALERLVILIAIQAGTAGVVTPTFQQHNAASAGTSKALTLKNDYCTKVNAETVFTKVDGSAGYSSVVLGATVGANTALLAFEVLPEELDVNNGFGYVSVNLPAVGQARVASILLCAKEAEFKPAHEVSI